MIRIFTRTSFVLLVFLLLVSCSSSVLDDFTTVKPESDFSLFEMFTEYPALSEMWDSINGEEVNTGLGTIISENEYEFNFAARSLADILAAKDSNGNEVPPADRPLPGLLRDFGFFIYQMMDNEKRYNTTKDIGSFYNTDANDYYGSFCEFLNTSSIACNDGSTGVGETLIPIMETMITKAIEENTSDGDYTDLRDSMNDLVDGMSTESFNDDYVDIMKSISKFLIRCDYSKHVDGAGNVITDYQNMSSGTDIGVGNLVKGAFMLVSDMILSNSYENEYDPIDREDTYAMLMEIRNAVLKDPKLTYIVKSLVQNIESYFTEGGVEYESRSEYSSRNGFDSGNPEDWGAYFSDAELRNMSKELLANMIGVFLRSDRQGAFILDQTVKDYVSDKLAKANFGIDWKHNKIDESLYDLLRYDLYGRDRLIDPGAYKSSFLESFLYLAYVAVNIGFKHGGQTLEFDTGSNYDAAALCSDHGHGQMAGVITMNDALYSTSGQYDASAAMMGLKLSTYELGFDEFGVSGHADHIYRSVAPYTLSGRNPYKFNYSINYPVLAFLSGYSSGDTGIESGGNPRGGGGDNVDEYRSYYPTGHGILNGGGWNVSTIVRATWEGEGPYYYIGENPTTVEFSVLGENRTWEVAYCPNGEVYAYIDRSVTPWEYFYPTRPETAEINDAASVFMDMTDNLVPVEYISSVDLSSGITVTGSPFSTGAKRFTCGLDGKSFEVTFPGYQRLIDPSKHYSYEEIIAEINKQAGYQVCSVYSGGKIRFISYDDFSLDTEANNSVRDLFTGSAASVNVPFVDSLSADAEIQITVDDNNPVSVFFSASAGPWTPSSIYGEIYSSLSSSGLGGNVIKINNNTFMIKGDSTDPNVANVTIEDVSGDALNELFASDGTISKNSPGRINRYKDTWISDFYMVVSDAGKAYTPNDMSGNAALAGCVGMNEIIDEVDVYRCCRTQEEALYRNFQYVLTEKKFLIVIPLWLRNSIMGLSEIESAAYQVIEGNGLGGICAARKFRGPGIWAKANHNLPVSTIPGDFRVDVRAASIQNASGLATVDREKIYESLGRGISGPAILYSALPAIYRFAFPRQNCKTIIGTPGGSMCFEQDQLGSSDASRPDYDPVTSGFAVGDSQWNKRNTLLPVIIAFFGALHQYSTENNHAIIRIMDALGPMIKPVGYYNNTLQNNGRDVCTKGWLPRIQGSSSDLIYQIGTNAGHASYLAPDCFIKGFLPYVPTDSGYSKDYKATDEPEAWFGGWHARNYYQPAPLPTLLTFLIDSDPSENRSDTAKRCDSLLPLICGYDVSKSRSDINKAKTDLLSRGVKTLASLGDSDKDDPPGINYAENHKTFDEKYSQWGSRRRISYGLEQMLTSLKMSEGITQRINLSNAYKCNDTDGDGIGADVNIPKWIFQGRPDDIDVDEAIDNMIGTDNDPDIKGKGLAAFPDDNQTESGELLSHNETHVEDYLDLFPNSSTGNLKVYAFKRYVNNGVKFQINTSEGSMTGADISSIVSGVANAIPDGITLADEDEDGDGINKRKITFTLDDALKDFTITCDYRYNRSDNWHKIDEHIADINDFFDDYIDREGKWCMYDMFLDTADAVLAKNRAGAFTGEQIKGLFYTLGKIVARYDGSGGWSYDGETDIHPADGNDFDPLDQNKILRVLTLHMPEIHRLMKDKTNPLPGENAELYGERYYTLLVILQKAFKHGDVMLDDEGLMQFLFRTVNTGDYGWEDVFFDLANLSPDVYPDDPELDDGFLVGQRSPLWRENTEMWDVLISLITDLSKGIEDTDAASLREILKKYGFCDIKY